MSEQVDRHELVLRGGVVVTMDAGRTVLDPGDVAVAGGRIVAVAPGGQLPDLAAVRVVDCSGCAVLPGLVDCHNHLFQGLSRGLGDGLALWDWLTRLIWPYADHVTPEDARAAALLAAVEAVRAGTTSLLDNHYAPADSASTLAVAEAMEEVGLRGAVARGIFGSRTDVARDRGIPDLLFGMSAEEELEATEACLDARPAGGRVEVWPAPINPTYVEPDLLVRAVGLARQAGVRWHTHCAEVRADVETSIATHGVRPLVRLAREGLLGGATVAHGIWLDDEEVACAAEAGAAVSHCPVANQYLASGVAPVGELRRAGVKVGLGTDGPAGGQRQDLFECMKSSVLLQRVHALDPSAARAEDALEMATIDGAALLGVDGGSLEPGKLADLVVVDLRGPHLHPFHRAATALAYSARGADVRMTVVGGEVVFEDGRCTRVDEDEVVVEAQARAEALVERAGLSHLRIAWGVPRGPAG
jgi:5-methylthioadenosine/S-adenosylhomocysteine deaminase